MLYPKFFTTLRGYTWSQFGADVLAGIIVGVVAIPLAIAFSIASGVPPEKGLVTAVVAGFLISFLGGSRVQIGGPTGAFVVIVYGIVQHYGIEGLTIATIMAGLLLICMGLAGLGAVIQYIPYSVIVGFTSGIAVIIFSSQIKDFFGLQTETLPADFIEKCRVLAAHAGSFNVYALLISSGTVLLIQFWPRVSRKIPGSLIALVLFSILTKVFHLPVETIASRFGDLPHSLPRPVLPHIDIKTIGLLLKPAMTIAILGAIESLLSAVVSDGMIGGRHRSNMELAAQGTANVASGLFGGIPATGAIARTVTNVKNGGRTPVAGMVHALTVLVILLFFGQWAKWIPLSCLAGVLAVVSYNMSEWRSFLGILRGSRGGILVLLSTFTITVLFDLTAAIEIGIVLSAFLFMHRMAEVTRIQLLDKEIMEEEGPGKDRLMKFKVPDGVEVYEVNGPFFFAISHKFEEAVRTVSRKPKVRILRMKNVPMIDSTGIQSLKQFHSRCQGSHVKLILAGVQPQVLAALSRSGAEALIGKENFCAGMHEAFKRAAVFLEPQVSY